MKKYEVSPKGLLSVDLAICSVWLLCVSHITGEPLLMQFPILRIWLSFLTYSRSKLAWCPLGLLTIANLTLIKPYTPIYELYLSPIIKIVRRGISLCGGNSDIVEKILLPRLGEGVPDIWETTMWIWFIGFTWSVGIPLAMYLYRAAKKRLVPTSWNDKKGWRLFGYMLVVIYLPTTVFFNTHGLLETMAVHILLVLPIPILFCNDRTKQILTQAQTTYLSIMALLAVGYLIGVNMDDKSILTTLTIPTAVYVLVCRYLGRKTPYWEYLSVTFAMWCFWQAQNTTDTMRMMLLMISAVLVGFAIIRFIHSTKLRLAGWGLFLAVGFAIPAMCIGYNPFSVVSARRLYACRDYIGSPNGMLYVRSESGRGIRDRYGIILPAEYDAVHILIPHQPYFKVQKSGKWRIYDIVRHEFVGNDSYTTIVPNDDQRFLMQNDKGKFLFDLSEPYSRDRLSATITAINGQ